MRATASAISAILAAAVTASPLYPRQNGTTPTACSSINAMVQAQKAVAPDATPTIAAEAAWDCIQSVPLNTTAALDLVKSLRPFLKWQSTTAYLKAPPPEYAAKIQPPVDIDAGMDQIEDNLKDGVWTKEYDFGFAVYRLLQSAHDGHFTYIPDVVGGVFTWGRPAPLVSVSEDGNKIPSVFVYSDILAASSNSGFQASALSKINGQDAIQWLENWSQFGSLQDRDALWNNVFYGLAQVGLGPQGTGTGTFSGGGRGRWIYPGPTTELEFVNGSTASLSNYARVLVDFSDITSGEDLYQKYFAYPDLTIHLEAKTKALPMTPASTATPTSSASAAAKKVPAPGYPAPVVRESNNLIGGYFLDDPAYADVAVLSVPSFVSIDSAEIEFQSVGQQFLATAKAAGKTKLIVDVSANAGGTILQGYDLFKQLFPHLEPYSAADRLRAHEAVNIIGNQFSAISGQYPRTLDLPDLNIVDIESTPLNYRSDLVPSTSKHFHSWAEKYGPETYHGDDFTNTFKWWLSDPLTTWNSGGIVVTGYLNRTGFTQPFAAEDIVVVYDGYCASTCTIFSELMRQKAGVEAVAMGGRPSSDLIQAVGGTKGTNDFPWSYIQSLVEETYNYSTPDQRLQYQNTELAEYNNYLPFYRAVGGPTVNARDGIRKGDVTNTPLQFVYEEADCRIFYTPQMTVDIGVMWKKVADAKWGGKGGCVAGGLGGKKGYNNDDSNDDDDGDEKRSMKKRGITERAALQSLSTGQLRLLTESLGVETNARVPRSADGFMAP